jgi:hypothetical protein
MKSRAVNGHNSKARAATRRVIPAYSELADSKPARHGNYWEAVQGPHLRVVRSDHRRNRTGCVGISISRSKRGRTYYVANLGSTNRRYCIETLGRAEAFKRALQARAKHELTVQAANEAILAARGTAK